MTVTEELKSYFKGKLSADVKGMNDHTDKVHNSYKTVKVYGIRLSNRVNTKADLNVDLKKHKKP